MADQTFETKMTADVSNLTEGLKKISVSIGDLDGNISKLLKHFDRLASIDLSKVEAQTIKINSKLSNVTNAAVGTGGIIVSDSGRGKKYKELQEQIVRTQEEEFQARKALTEKIKKQTELLEKEYQVKAKKAEAKLIKANKEEDKTSESYKKFRDAQTRKINESAKWRAYREEHPELFANGGGNFIWKKQIAKSATNIGKYISPMGAGGRVAGDILQASAGILKAPAAGTMGAITLLGKSLIDLGKAATTAYADIEATKTQLGVVFSSQTQANAMFGDISQYAVKSPFGIQQTSELAILLKQSGVYASDLMKTLKMLGDTAGGNMEKMKRIANNYAQIVSIGKASMLDMRQFAYAGIPIFEAVSKELGVSQQELRKLISDGKVTSDIIEKVFKDLTGINGIFENATEKGAKTLKARLQNLSDAKQLALSAFGDFFVNFGSQTGNDSWANKLVATGENIYKWLYNWKTVGNIEQSVKVIERRDNKIEHLQKLIDYVKASNDPNKKELLKGLEKAITEELEKRDPDKERASYLNAYQTYTKEWLEAVSKGESRTLEELKAELNRVSREASAYAAYAYSPNQYPTIQGQNPSGFRVPEGTSVTEAKLRGEALAIQQKDLENLIKAIEDYTNVKERPEYQQASYEQHLITSQLAFAESTDKFAHQTNSYVNLFQELSNLEENSTKRKLEEEEKHIEKLKEAQSLLKQLNDKSKNGFLDFSKIDLKQFLKLQEQGAFTVGRKLTVTDGKSEQEARNDAAIIKENLKTFSFASIRDFMNNAAGGRSGSGSAVFEAIYNAEKKLEDKTGSEYLKEFAKQETTITNALNQFHEATGVSVKDLIDSLAAVTTQLEISNKGLNADIDDARSSTKTYIPLWKRILAANTGLTTNGMTSTRQTLENYRDDMANRKLTANVLGAVLKTSGIETAQNLMRFSGEAKILPGDTRATYQVDWVKTGKAVSEFAKQLSASTEVISAYKQSLEEQIQTYENLIVAGYTEAESQDLKNQKTISAKKLTELTTGNGEQLVNAFGEKLVTSTGLKVTFKDGKFFDEKNNNVLVDELRVTGELFDFIKRELPNLKNELGKVKIIDVNNKEINKIADSTFTSFLNHKFTEKNKAGKSSQYIIDNPEYANTLFRDTYESFRGKRGAVTGFENVIYEDFVKEVQTVTDERVASVVKKFHEAYKKVSEDPDNKEYEKEYEEAVNNLNVVTGALQALNEVLKEMGKEVNNVTSSPSYKNYEQQNRDSKRIDSVINRINYLEDSKNYESTPYLKNISAQDLYSGNISYTTRQIRNKWAEAVGLDRGFDRETYLAEAVKTGMTDIHGNKVISKEREEAFKDADGNWLPESDIVEKLTEAEKKAFSIKDAFAEAGDALDKMGSSILRSVTDSAKDAYMAPFKTLGESLVTGENAAENLRANMKQIAGELLKNVGTAMATAGFQIAGAAALDQQWGLVAGGLALAAAGGFASGIGGALSSSDKDNDKESDDKVKRLESLRDSLIELLAQAREDAIYYETTLRHRKALSTNGSVSGNVTSVNDAVITPQGKVIKTHPEDYLFATKTPQALVSGHGGGVPKINFNLIDKSTGVSVTTQKADYNEKTNTIEFEAIIESKIGEYIASDKSDDAFAARNIRLRGRSVIA